VNRYCLLSAAIVAASVAACATTDNPQMQSSAHKDRVYTTGSRIPVRDDAGSADVKSVDNRQGVDDMMKNKDVVVPQKGLSGGG
jgi:hypothetical protein